MADTPQASAKGVRGLPRLKAAIEDRVIGDEGFLLRVCVDPEFLFLFSCGFIQ